MPTNEQISRTMDLSISAENDHRNAQFNLGYAYGREKGKATIDVGKGIKLTALKKSTKGTQK